MNNRQHWVLNRFGKACKSSGRSSKAPYEIGWKTAERDLSGLSERGLIEFVRTPRSGHYQLVKR